MAELAEYCNSEGAELGRYAVNTARRVEELKDFRGEARSYLSITSLLILHLVHLADGLKREHEKYLGEWAIALHGRGTCFSGKLVSILTVGDKSIAPNLHYM